MSDVEEQYTPDPDEPEGYDAYVRKQVQLALDEVAQPDAVFYTVEESTARLQQAKIAWLKRRGEGRIDAL